MFLLLILFEFTCEQHIPSLEMVRVPKGLLYPPKGRGWLPE